MYVWIYASLLEFYDNILSQIDVSFSFSSRRAKELEQSNEND